MRRRGRPPHPDVLTPRQWEVLALIREGLTDREIARRLGISLDGVKFHVSEILGKLGVTSRNEAARWSEQRAASPTACLVRLTDPQITQIRPDGSVWRRRRLRRRALPVPFGEGGTLAVARGRRVRFLGRARRHRWRREAVAA